MMNPARYCISYQYVEMTNNREYMLLNRQVGQAPAFRLSVSGSIRFRYYACCPGRWATQVCTSSRSSTKHTKPLIVINPIRVGTCATDSECTAYSVGHDGKKVHRFCVQNYRASSRSKIEHQPFANDRDVSTLGLGSKRVGLLVRISQDTALSASSRS